MNTIFKTEFGSCMYGTSLPTSDKDFKAIYLPEAKDILLQQVKDNIHQGTKLDKNAKNNPDDIDFEIFSLQEYLKLLLEGQTVSLDMLFAPTQYWCICTQTWCDIQENKKEFLHSGVLSFIGYAKQQANKYGIKGSRVSAVRSALDVLNNLPDQEKLKAHWIIISEAFKDKEHSNIVEIRGPNGIPEPHLEVCNRKVPHHATVKYAKSVYQKIFDEYGARALLAEQNEGVDWKALMHAVRVQNQAIELLSTAHITFPRPEKDFLLQIRKGELPYKQVAENIEEGFNLLQEASQKSILPKEPNYKLAEEIVLHNYKRMIK